MQLWKLTRFELKKAVGSRFFAIAFFLLLLVNIVIWCGDWKSFGVGREITELFKDQYAVLDALTEEERIAFETAMIEKYGEDVFNPFFSPTAEMMSPPGYFGETYSDFTMVWDYSYMQQKNEDNEALYQNVLNAAKGFGREALKDGNDYEVRRNLEIIRLYSVPREELRYEVRSWDDFLFGTHTMILVLLLILQSCAGIFTKETDGQTWLLLHTAKNGKGKTLAAKFIAAGIIAACITLFFQGVSLIMVYLNYGLLGVSESVAGIQELAVFPYTFTVGQYVVLALACQVFAAVAMSLLLSAVSAFSKSSVISYVVGGLLLGGSILLLFNPPRMEWLAGPLALAQPERYFTSFYTANIFGYPVLWAVVQVVLWSVLAAGCIVLSHKIYHRKRRRV